MTETAQKPLTDYQRGLADGIHAAGQYPTLMTDVHFLHDFVARYPQPADHRVHEPQLLEACREMLEFVSGSSGVSGWHLNGRIIPWGEVVAVESIRAAVADATGEHNQ